MNLVFCFVFPFYSLSFYSLFNDVFYCCSNKSPQSSCLKRAQIYYLTALGIRNLKAGLTASSTYPEGCVLLEAREKNYFLPFKISGGSLHSTPCSYGIVHRTSYGLLTPPSHTLTLLFLHIF